MLDQNQGAEQPDLHVCPTNISESIIEERDELFDDEEKVRLNHATASLSVTMLGK